MRLRVCCRVRSPELRIAELEGKAPTTFAAGVTGEPALAAKDTGDALWHGFAAPTTSGDYGRSAEEFIPGLRDMWMVEGTTTVGAGGGFHG